MSLCRADSGGVCVYSASGVVVPWLLAGSRCVVSLSRAMWIGDAGVSLGASGVAVPRGFVAGVSRWARLVSLRVGSVSCQVMPCHVVL